MARPLRIHIPGKAYHLFARGDNKAAIFRDDEDCARFLDLLTRVLGRFAVQCLAYCLLWNHFHLLVIPREHSVSRLMHDLNGTYCQWFNRRHKRVGHVLQGRFGSRIVDESDYMLTALRYIAMNPVAGGQVTRPDDWVWSSYRATAGICAAPVFLALDAVWSALHCPDPVAGRARYIAHVAGGADSDELQKALLFGDDLLVRQVRPLVEPHRDTEAFVHAERFAATRPPLDAILLNADSPWTVKRAARDAFHRYGYTLQEIGDMVGRTPSSISKWIAKVNDGTDQNLGGISKSWH
ncbi:MAG TPA: transposase [Vicinamibacterales bacterium]|nr:transposase [Vicinamibacterales bacterium]